MNDSSKLPISSSEKDHYHYLRSQLKPYAGCFCISTIATDYNSTRLIIGITEKELQKISKEIQLVIEQIPHREPEILFKTYSKSFALDEMKLGNPYFIEHCFFAEDILGIDPGFPETLTTNNLSLFKSNFQEEMARIKKLREVAKFHINQKAFTSAAFKYHQVFEFLFRVVERIVTGESKITRSLITHQKYIAPFQPDLGVLFNIDAAYERRLLIQLDYSFVVSKKSNRYLITRKDLDFIEKKSKSLYHSVQAIFTKRFQCCEKLVSQEIPQLRINRLTSPSLDLKKVSEIIVQKLNPLCIYFVDSKRDNKKAMGILIFVIVETGPIPPVSDISYEIFKKTSGEYHVSLLCHTQKQVEQERRKRNLFFEKIISSSLLLFSSPGTTRIDENSAEVDIEPAPYRSGETRLSRAEEFFHMAHFSQLNDEKFRLCLLHHGIEQLFLGFLEVHWKYRPNHFSLAYLLELSSFADPIVSSLFPIRSKHDRRLLKLLSASKAEIRFTHSSKDRGGMEVDKISNRCQQLSKYFKNFLNRNLKS